MHLEAYVQKFFCNTLNYIFSFLSLTFIFLKIILSFNDVVRCSLKGPMFLISFIFVVVVYLFDIVSHNAVLAGLELTL